MAAEEWEGCDVRGGRGRRIRSAMTLTAALRVWDPACFAEHAGRVAGAVVQAVIDHDLSVSGEGRRLYWAARSCAATSGAEVGTFDKYSSEGKVLMRERGLIEAEWGEDGRLTRLARIGMLDWERSGQGAALRGGQGRPAPALQHKRAALRQRRRTSLCVPCLPSPFRPSPL